MASNLTQKWHGAPVWVWAAGGVIVSAGAVYAWKKYQANKASNANNTMPTGAANDTTGGTLYPFGGGGGSGSDIGNLLGQQQQATQQEAQSITDAGTQAVSAINDAVTTALKQIPAGMTSPPVPAAPVPAPPPPAAAVAPSLAPGVSLVAPSGYTATPINVGGTIVGENLTNNNDQVQVTAPWQQALGLAPADVGTTAVPINVGGTTVGENFIGQSVNPPPPQLYTGGTPGGSTPQGIMTQYGLVTQAQYDLLKATGRL